MINEVDFTFSKRSGAMYPQTFKLLRKYLNREETACMKVPWALPMLTVIAGWIRLSSVLQLLGPCLNDRESRPGRLYRSNKLEACISTLQKALPRAYISFSGANQRQHMQIADPARQSGLVNDRMWGMNNDQGPLTASPSQYDLALY